MFEKIPVASIAEIFLGGTPKRSEPLYWGDDISWASAADVASCNSKYLRKTTEKITFEGLENSAAKLLEKDTIVITARGTVGAICMLPSLMAFNQTCYGLRVKNNLSATYLYYALKASIANIKSQTYGAVFDTITMQSFNNICVPLPSLPIQHKIASILSAYDDLIENNTRRIQILEDMAQAIYREWFVNYRFPGYEDVKLVESELGLIPEGWKVDKLNDVLETLESGSRPKGGIDQDEREVPSIGAENILGIGKYDYSKEKYISQEFFYEMRRGIIKNQDVLLYKDGAKIGRKSLFRDGFPHKVCSINEHVFILRSNDNCTQSYLYFWLDLPNITQAIINLNTNAAQPGISQAKVKSLPILVPIKPIINNFEEIVEPLIALLINLAKKNEVLRKTRDLLLPRLISGNLDMSDLDRHIREEIL